MLRYKTEIVWFSHLVRHSARKRSGYILTTRSLHGALAHRKTSAKFTMNCRKEAGTEIVVKVLVFTHIINLLPFSLCHLLLHQLWCHLILIRVKTTVLPNNDMPSVLKVV